MQAARRACDYRQPCACTAFMSYDCYFFYFITEYGKMQVFEKHS